MADLHRIAVGRRHEFGIVLANITAALMGAGGEAHGHDKQAQQHAPLPH
ncbi:MAG: hypothetical protein ABSA62_04540 [Methyloceanibacter sp.]